ncbi:hypothetical protein CEP53_001407 [Fusarium sp. AF-6]|nr:hypothetical protein CEP53_001407 [Fusarium sp. AF-6]
MPETWLLVVYDPAIERPMKPASRYQAKPLGIVGRTLLTLSINACRDGPKLLNRTRTHAYRTIWGLYAGEADDAPSRG